MRVRGERVSVGVPAILVTPQTVVSSTIKLAGFKSRCLGRKNIRVRAGGWGPLQDRRVE